MKNYLLLLFLGLSLFAAAQNPDKITFDYDTAGNQIKRELCLSCIQAGYKTKAPKEIAALQKEDLQKFLPEDVISYYPNPVKEELYLKWELIADKTVTSIYLYALNGQVMKTYNNLEKTNALNIPFLNYPTGAYLVVLVYNDGDQKTIKIVK
ncbi:MAG: T9SS type A sorting domain-containing protein [Flavobacterium sp.]|uniref:T9SS type A sorting domain-containing protein n=1 Tax=Flavobacterium sp. TaxID=239 RepID=UPI0026196A3D|nr:T9SS type A sorting domain-containing protein [Flavobacterium sp.]MDD5150454.1 T9SS type A sorting domain-containing protein [Flavobacterium sp.]